MHEKQGFPRMVPSKIRFDKIRRNDAIRLLDEHTAVEVEFDRAARAQFGVSMDILWKIAYGDLIVCRHCGDKSMDELVGHGSCLKCGEPE